MLTVAYERNYELNGIEIKFSEKPSEQIREDLLRNKWRYSKYKKLWYHFYSDENLKYAKKLSDKINKTNTPKKPSRDIPTYTTAVVTYSTTSSGSNTRKCDEKMKERSRERKEYDAYKYAEAQLQPLGQFIYKNPRDVRYQKKRSFFS